jgi:hypothetical protein
MYSLVYGVNAGDSGLLAQNHGMSWAIRTKWQGTSVRLIPSARQSEALGVIGM